MSTGRFNRHLNQDKKPKQKRLKRRCRKRRVRRPSSHYKLDLKKNIKKSFKGSHVNTYTEAAPVLRSLSARFYEDRLDRLLNLEDLEDLEDLYEITHEVTKDQKTTNTPKDTIAEKTEDECIVCRENKRCLAFQPCGHVPSCHRCFEQLTKCPMCRQVVENTVHIFW